MRLLIVANPENAECGRLLDEAKRLGHDAQAASVRAIVFEAGRRTRAFVDGADVAESFDCVYLRNIFPCISEGLHLAEMADDAGLAVIDSCLATRNYVQSKTYNSWKLERAGIASPPGFLAGNEDEVRDRLAGARFPVVVKGVHGSQGQRVHLCADADAVIGVMRSGPEMPFVVQERLDIVHEYRVLTIGFRAIGAIEKHAAPGDFRHNLSLGGTAEPIRLPETLLKMCEDASKILGYEFAGADLAVLEDGSEVMLEVNRAPGFCGYEAATGENVAAEFIEYASKKAEELKS